MVRANKLARIPGLRLLPLALLILTAACSSGSSGSSTPTVTATATAAPSTSPTATPTAVPSPSIRAQAPINGIVAIFGAAGAAKGVGTVIGSGATQTGSAEHLSRGCPVSGSGTSHPDGSFSLSVCASAGARIALTYKNNQGQSSSLGSITVPTVTQLPSCPAGFRTFTLVNSSNQEMWIGEATGGGVPPVACTVGNPATCGPNQLCLATNSCTSFNNCNSSNQCDSNNGVCMAPNNLCNNGVTPTLATLSSSECVGRTGASCNQSGCDAGFTCDTSTGLCTTSNASLQNNSACSTAANCGNSQSCTWTDQVLECNGGSCFYSSINPGEITACSSSSQCPAGQVCNTGLGLCQWQNPALGTGSVSTIPDAELEIPVSGTTVMCMPGGVAPTSFWAGKINNASSPLNGQARINNTSSNCYFDTDCESGRCLVGGGGPVGPHQQAGTNTDCSVLPVPTTSCSSTSPCPNGQQCNSVTGQCQYICKCSATLPWSGNMFARTGCQSDGTQCQTGDCNNLAYGNCPIGKGGNPPDTLAEFTLGAQQVDYYDVSNINGTNLSIQMGPAASPAPSPVPNTTAYQCETAGSTSAQGGGISACSWNFDLSNVDGGDQTTFLNAVTAPSCGPTQGCPSGYTCTDPSSSGICLTTQACAPSLPACPAGQTCSDGFCSPAAVCNSTTPCPGGSSCTFFNTGACVPNQLSCTTSSQCPGSMPCVGGFCSPQVACGANTPCAAGLTCQNNLCVPACSADSDCTTAATGLESATCQAGVCTPLTCDNGVTCPNGYSCDMTGSFGTCTPTQTSCSVTNPCSSNHQVCSIPSGQTTGTCTTQLQCPADGSAPSGNYTCGPSNLPVPSKCTSDSQCASVAGTCNTATGLCSPVSADSANPTCPTGMTYGANGQCLVSCASSSSCEGGTECGTAMISTGGYALAQVCGESANALWTYVDYCPAVPNNAPPLPPYNYGPVQCNATAQTPPGGSPATDTFTNMFGCNGSSTGSAVSCYSLGTATSYCCGCPTAQGVDSGWPTVLGPSFQGSPYGCNVSNSVWQESVMPWLQYEKAACPSAYTFAYDDATSTFTCATSGLSPTNPNSTNYNLTFSNILVNGTTLGQ